MAARNVKSVSGFEAADKMQSSTLKRQPSPDWSKNDLLRLLSYFEGELQARDITIAALKAEKAKQLLYQAKYGRFGLGDPFVALQRDTIGTRDSNFDEAAVKSMYDNQLAQLENLIATQRKAQLKMREQLANAEKRYHKVCSELEDEKRKHAQDTAQGDDVTYMLEKERERLRQEIDFEKSSSKKLEKDLRRTLAALEEERASANRHKQVALLLLKERKHILQKLAASGQSSSQGDYSLPEEMCPEGMAEGLEMDPHRTLTMEAALEEQLGKIEAERTALHTVSLDHEHSRTRDLERQVEALQRQVQTMAAQSGLDVSDTSKVGAGLHHLLEAQPQGPLSMGPVSPNASPSGYSQVFVRSPVGLNTDPSTTAGGRPVAIIGATASPHVRPGVNRVVDGGRIGSISPEREVIHRPTEAARKMQYGAGGYSSMVLDKQASPNPGGGGAGGASVLSSSPREARVVTVGSSGPDSSPLIVGGSGSGGGGVGGSSAGLSSGGGARVNISTGNNATVVTQGAGKISFHVSAGAGGVIVGGTSSSSSSPQRPGTGGGGGGGVGAGRGHPPPVPPNKPNIPGGPGITSTSPGKPAPPPKVAVIGGRERGGMDGKVVQIPVNVVTSASSSSSSSPSTGSQSSRDSSPIRKTAQLPPPSVTTEVALGASPNSSVAHCSAGLEFLGPEMASLQELLAALSTGEASARDSPGLASPSLPSPSTVPSPSPSFPFPPLPHHHPQPSTSPSSSSLSHPPTSPPPPYVITTPSSVDVENSAVHRMSASGDLNALRTLILQHDADVNLPLKDGTTPLHCAVENDRETCLQLLLDKGGNAGALRDDRVTPVHIAAALGHARCLKLLLERGSAANIQNEAGDTPLHLAVDGAHLACCQLLLLHGANVTLPRQDGLTAVHYAVWRDQPEMLSCLLDRLPPNHSPPACLMGGPGPGASLVHLAAHLTSEACLRVLLEKLAVPVDVTAEDGEGRSVLSVASPACRTLLTHLGEQSGASLPLTVELKTQLEGTTVSCTRIGTVDLAASWSWGELEAELRQVLGMFLGQLDQGLRTRRLMRMEAEAGSRDDFSLGISMAHVSMFEMSFYRWSPGMQTEKLPYSLATNNTEKKVAIIIDDMDNFCELIAFDILHPVPVLQEYLRLLDQYKSVVFHGPVNSGKSYLVQRLAQCWAVKQKAKGEKPSVCHLKLSSKTTHDDLVTFLKQKGCLLPLDQPTDLCPVLIVDNLERVSLTQLFGPLLDPLAHRGHHHPFHLTEHVNGNGQKFYFPENFCILATLNRSRSTGIELHVQQRFRWVHFRHDTEPLRNLLARHFLRRLYHLGNGRLPGPDDPLLRATEWIICIWQRLNDSLGKLGLPDVVLGPCSFFKCPLEKKNPQLILQWVQDLWNQTIAPQVREGVKRSTGGGGAPGTAAADSGLGGSGGGGHNKVANTALYVLMQRAVVVSCPLPVKEKEAYLQGFSGSNELDLPFKSEKGRQVKATQRSEPVKEGGDNSPSPLSGAGNSRGPNGSSLAGRSQNSNTYQAPVSSPAARPGSKHREERGRSLELFAGNIKRRSLSESAMNKAARRLDQLEQEEEEERQQQQQQQQQQSNFGLSSPAVILSHHAKVPKLEMRSSRILSLSNSFKTSPTSLLGADGKSGRVSPLSGSRPSHHHHSHSHHHHQHQHHHHQHKKSRSSENISPSGLYSGKGVGLSPSSQNPFSFSLSTPKSSLMSFKFFDKSSSEQSVLSSPSLSSSSSSPLSAVTSSLMSDNGHGSSAVDSDNNRAQTVSSVSAGSAVMDVTAFSTQQAAGSVQ